ncbi:YecA family protein [Simplicispira hankyongi]|uniref:YecA family protein n=2 Tax=Simplicispira hankyongi TaxID=2315688 RepID=A0A398CMH3_9BURK|nr:YecA family protein [Simplicispira hankyongi]
MMIGPLSEAELDELDQFLLYLDEEESMTLDTLDGFLHAIAIGPETVMPSRWLPKVWGQADGGMVLPGVDADQMERVLSLVMRHFNSIVFGFGQRPPFVEPLWGTTQYGELGEFEDPEMWAYGFSEGVNLNRTAWQALLNDPQGKQWYRPIGLLGEDDFSPDKDALTRTPEQRQALAGEIAHSVQQIHAFWLPLRHAVAGRQQAQRMSIKLGRNEPCPCGSGKKFKKCCGAPSELH